MRNGSTRKGRADNARIIAASDTCAICGQTVDKTLTTPDPMSPEVDHIIPLAQGGTDSITNKQLTHRICNGRKAAKEHAPIIKRSGALN